MEVKGKGKVGNGTERESQVMLNTLQMRGIYISGIIQD
jgi:hypothetical protein